MSICKIFSFVLLLVLISDCSKLSARFVRCSLKVQIDLTTQVSNKLKRPVYIFNSVAHFDNSPYKVVNNINKAAQEVFQPTLQNKNTYRQFTNL